MEILRRLTAAMLALVMVVTMLPVSVLATETDPTIPETTAETEPVDVGEVVPDVPLTDETEAVETVPETTAPEVFVEDTAQTFGAGIGGECGEGMTWSLVNGVLTISGVGEVEDDHGYTPWYNYRDQITRVVIPAGVVYDRLEAFYQCSELTSAYIGMESIPGTMFRDCDKLTDVTLEESVVSIGGYAFSECDSLTEIVIPDSVVSIGKGAFQICPNLTSATLPKGLTMIPDDLFNYCPKLEKANIPVGVTEIGNRAFTSCDLEAMELPEGLISIGDYAFSGCHGMDYIYIPASVESIGERAFDHSSLFDDNKTKAFQVAPENAHYSSDDRGVLFDKNKTVLINAPMLLSGSYTVPSSVKTIKYGAFDSCDYLTEIQLPDTLTSIEGHAFRGCRRLTRANIPSALTVITAYSFSDCPLEDIILPEGLQKIEQEAFWQSFIVDDPGVEPTVTELIIPESMKEIGSAAFGSIYSFEKVTFLGDAPAVNLSSVWESPPFRGINADFYYYADNETWTEEAKYALTGNSNARWHAIGAAPNIKASLVTYINDENLICGTVYDTIHNTATYAMHHTVQLEPSEAFTNVTLNLTLPEGFSFEEGKLTTQTTMEVGDLPVTFFRNLPTIYPIYIDEDNQAEEYKLTIEIFGIDTTGEVRTSTEKKVFYRPTDVNNSAPANCVNYKNVADYSFSPETATGSGSVYNQETARLCAMMSDMAYNEAGMESFLTTGLGFSEFEKYGLSGELDLQNHECGRYYATKKIIKDGKIRDLVYVICRGTPMQFGEWYSNAQVDSGVTHQGFDTAASVMKKELAQYCKEQELNPSTTYVVVTGHSRGAAISNLLGHWLNTSAGLAQKENVSVYTFATPTVDRRIVSEASAYPGHENIFNFVYYQDIIRNAPSMQNYGRYGTTRIFGFSTAEDGASVHSDGYGNYSIPVAGSNYTTLEYLNSILYSHDPTNLIRAARLGGDILKLRKILSKYIEFDSVAFNEELYAHEDTCYSAVVQNAPAADVQAVNKRTEEAYEFFHTLIKQHEAGEVYIESSFCCPINVYVYDTNGNEVASIVDKKVTCNDSNLILYVMGEAQTVGMLESQLSNYTIKVEGYDNGTMTHCIQTVGIDGIKDIQVRRDIPIVKDGIWEVGSDGYIEDASGYTKYEDPKEIEDILTNLDNPAPSHDFQLGDVNHDGKINAKDATLILQSSVGVLKETAKFCETCAEVSGDGKLNAKDSTLILQFSVGLRDSFPAAEK